MFEIMVLSIIVLLLGIAIRPVRKAMGLVLIVLGILECLSIVGLILGIPSILIGGIFLFS